MASGFGHRQGPERGDSWTTLPTGRARPQEGQQPNLDQAVLKTFFLTWKWLNIFDPRAYYDFYFIMTSTVICRGKSSRSRTSWPLNSSFNCVLTGLTRRKNRIRINDWTVEKAHQFLRNLEKMDQPTRDVSFTLFICFTTGSV